MIAATFAPSAAGATHFGQEFLPEFRETDSPTHPIEKPGTFVEEMGRTATRASKEPRVIVGVATSARTPAAPRSSAPTSPGREPAPAPSSGGGCQT